MSTSFRSHILNQHMNNEQTTHWTGCTAPVLFSTIKTCCYLQTNHSNEQPQRIRSFAVIVCKCVIVWFAVIRWRLSNTGMVLCVWTSSGARKSTQHTHTWINVEQKQKLQISAHPHEKKKQNTNLNSHWTLADCMFKFFIIKTNQMMCVIQISFVSWIVSFIHLPCSLYQNLISDNNL